MDTLDHLQRAVDYIEDNLRAELTAEEIAREAGFSVHHFYHLFASATGMPVMQFVTRRRLSHAAHEIACGDGVIDTALKYGFDSASGFSRAFRRAFGMPPRQYAKASPALRPERIVLKELTHIMISQKLITHALGAWNLTSPAVPLIHSSGARSENTFQIGEYLLHARESRSSLALAMAAEECLCAAGLPAVRTVPAADGTEIVALDGLFFRLTGRAPGNFVPAREMYADMSHPRAVGRALARLHEALKPLEELPELNRPNLLKSTLDWSLPKTAAAMKLPAGFGERFSSGLSRLYPSLPIAVIHRNPTPEAFLFEGGALTGYANFEMTEANIRLFDICYAATAILSETLGRLPDETTDRWPEVLRAIVQGYDEAAPLTEAEREAVPYVVCAVQMVCAAYFSGQEQFRNLAEVNMKMTGRIIGWLCSEMGIHAEDALSGVPDKYEARFSAKGTAGSGR